MNQMCSFFLNGEKYKTRYQATISDLIDYFGYNQSLLVVEYNQFICSKTEWDKISIQKNDKIEIVTIVGGG
uniref:Thiamine biosynthesis protein n=1 Tax=Halamphora americana TaxID=2305497 RepID=A0A516ZB51_9STRA|nr:thiamine biosynthesis protein [Halamphora americana]QDR24921.1 thiamine biosynthesis protein [Halamphora americana]